MDGRYSKYQIRQYMQRDEAWQAARSRLKEADLIIIDEASMISALILEQVWKEIQSANILTIQGSNNMIFLFAEILNLDVI